MRFTDALPHNDAIYVESFGKGVYPPPQDRGRLHVRIVL